MRNKSALMAGVLAGLASPGAFASVTQYPLPQGSDLDRLRGDTKRVGNDFSTVINREHGKQKYKAKPKSTPKVTEQLQH